MKFPPRRLGLPFPILVLASLTTFASLACAAPVDTSRAEPMGQTAEEPLSAGISLSVDAAPGLVPSTWSYRELATRDIPGCKDYDVLQGTGWFFATWYKTYTFTQTAGVYTVDLEHTLRAYLCAAKMDRYNAVAITRVDASAPGGTLAGQFAVNPDGTSAEATVTCTRNAAGNGLACDDAHVRSLENGQWRVHVLWRD